MADETYNGWTNKATWLVKLWIDNDQGSQEYWLDQARAPLNDYNLGGLVATLEAEFDEGADTNTNLQGVYSDLMSYALGSVNWHEIAEALIEDAKELV